MNLSLLIDALQQVVQVQVVIVTHKHTHVEHQHVMIQGSNAHTICNASTKCVFTIQVLIVLQEFYNVLLDKFVINIDVGRQTVLTRDMLAKEIHIVILQPRRA